MTVRRIKAGDDTDLVWYVLEGYVDGVPAVTTRRTLAVAALVSGLIDLASEREALELEIAAKLVRWEALQALDDAS